MFDLPLGSLMLWNFMLKQDDVPNSKELKDDSHRASPLRPLCWIKFKLCDHTEAVKSLSLCVSHNYWLLSVAYISELFMSSNNVMTITLSSHLRNKPFLRRLNMPLDLQIVLVYGRYSAQSLSQEKADSQYRLMLFW